MLCPILNVVDLKKFSEICCHTRITRMVTNDDNKDNKDGVDD